MRTKERRRRRSHNTTRALRYQLDACRSAASLEGMVLSDEDGVCLAAAGDGRACDEVAAQLPLLGRKVRSFEGVLLSAERGWEITMRRVRFADSFLYLAVIGGPPERRDSELRRSESGVLRILAA